MINKNDEKLFCSVTNTNFFNIGQGQTNTFPSSGNVGVGTLSPVMKRILTLHNLN